MPTGAYRFPGLNELHALEDSEATCTHHIIGCYECTEATEVEMSTVGVTSIDSGLH